MADPAAPKANVPATLDDVVAALAAQQTMLAAILAAVSKPTPLPPSPATPARGSGS